MLAMVVVWSVAPLIDEENGPVTPSLDFTGQVPKGTLTSTLSPGASHPLLTTMSAVRHLDAAKLPAVDGDVLAAGDLAFDDERGSDRGHSSYP